MTKSKQPVSEYDANPSGIVVGLAVSMGWQLALTVLVPIVGGHVVDDHLHPHSFPIFTLIGLLLAIAGMIVVVRSTLKELNKHMNSNITTPTKTSGDES